MTSSLRADYNGLLNLLLGRVGLSLSPPFSPSLSLALSLYTKGLWNGKYFIAMASPKCRIKDMCMQSCDY